MSRQMVGSEKAYGDPSEAISEVLENHLFEKASCYDVDLNAIARVLQATVSRKQNRAIVEISDICLVRWKTV